MKKLLIGIVLPTLIAVPLVASAQTSTPARDRSYDKTPARETSKDTRPAFRAEANSLETRKLVGMRVKNIQGKDLGEVDNLLIDSHSGKITHVVIGYGGFAGVGERKVVLPWSELKMDAADANKPTATVDQAKLDTAPRWERSARADQAPAASPTMRSPAKDTDKDGTKDRADKAPTDPTRK